jgi:polar amino acid transport system substrate-binding protein
MVGSRRVKKLVLILLVGALAVVAAGCGGDDEGSANTGSDQISTSGVGTGQSETGATGGVGCTPEELELVNDGQLTIGTDNPAFPPWFEGGTPEGSDWEINDPSTGEGFESAVAYAVAEQLGFSEDDVQWVVVPFNNSFRPGPKDFDFDINQISVTEERDRAVDFSESYYDVNQALVALEGTPIADTTSVSDLAQYQLGAQVGTTSLAYIQENIQPEQEPRVYDTSNDVVAALNGRQIDGIVVDLPTAFFLVGSGEVENGTVVGQFPSVGGQEHFGMLFEEGNPLRDCVDDALAELTSDGTLAQLQQEWLAEKTDAPVLE